MGNRQDMAAERQSLKDKLMAIILLETSKNYKEMDSDLVTECVDFLMELEGKERLTKSEIEERVSKIPFKGKVTAINSYAKKKIRAKRIAVIAAVLAVLLAIFSIFAVSYGRVEDGLINRFAEYISEVISGGDRLVFNDIELIKSNKTKRYSSAEKLVKDEEISILFPTWLPENDKIIKCWYIDDEIDKKHYIFQCENTKHSITLYLEKAILNRTKKENPAKNAGEHTVYIISGYGIVQGVFEHNGGYYSVCSDTEENLLKIIENLKEIE